MISLLPFRLGGSVLQSQDILPHPPEQSGINGTLSPNYYIPGQCLQQDGKHVQLPPAPGSMANGEGWWGLRSKSLGSSFPTLPQSVTLARDKEIKCRNPTTFIDCCIRPFLGEVPWSRTYSGLVPSRRSSLGANWPFAISAHTG